MTEFELLQLMFAIGIQGKIDIIILKNHPEAAGIVGLAGGDASIFEVSLFDIRVMERPTKNPVVVQTWKVVLIHSGP